MSVVRKLVYKMGFRPKLGSIFHSPSLTWFYGYHDYNKKAEQ